MSCPHCAAVNDDSARDCVGCGRRLGTLEPGQLVAGRWEVLARLGSGGMGVVYKVRDRELDEVVALKVLRGEMARSEEMARRFRSEIKLARRVRHPNVCGIHEYGQDGGLLFIVMEYVEGVDLKRVLSGGAVPHDQAFAVGAETAAALHAIHQAGIVHRDLKPANVMLDAQGRVRLMDFGIAKEFGRDAADGLTATGHIVGTPEYMSPEQVRGEAVDVRSDVYALGVLLFELFTGRVPFRSTSAVATLYQVVHEPVPVEVARKAGAPPALVLLLERALAKSPPDRYASAAEVERALVEARGSGVRREANPLTLVEAALALAPRPELDATPQPMLERTAVPAPTAVPVLAPTPAPAAAPPVLTPTPAPVPAARRAYAGPAPHRRSAQAEAAPGRRGLAWAVVACALGGMGVVAWQYGPLLRERIGAPAAATPVTMAAPSTPVGADPKPLPAGPAVPVAASTLPPASPAPEPTASPTPAIVTVAPSALPGPSVAPPAVAPAARTALEPSPAGGAPAPADTSLDRAEELFAQGRFASALAAAKAVLLRQPGNVQAQQLAEDAEVELMVDRQLKEARAAAAAGDRALALDKLKTALAAKPNDSRLIALQRELTRD